MPKCDVDRVLQDEMLRFISESGLSVSGAAAKLGVGRTTLWRFCDSGRARGDTRALYREALSKCNSNHAGDVADDAVSAHANAGQPRRIGQAGLTDVELKRIRKTCESVLALLEAYEAQALDSKS